MAASCREFTGLTRTATTRPPLPGRRSNELCFAPLHSHHAAEQEQQGRKGRRRRGRGVRVVVAAVSEELPRLATAGKDAAAGRPTEKVTVRAALTVRRKQKEDLKDAVAGHLDALWDMVGRSVVLELISTKIHPSNFTSADWKDDGIDEHFG